MKSFKAIFLALFGTLIEYYDYALYGFAAPILAQHFFPKDDPTVVLIQAYGIFFAGSCAKPLGSLIFGILGDRFGRAFALKISIFGIAIPTLSIGLLPDYQTLGWVAPGLLLLCRILQGMFVSGESDNARVFIFESLPKNRCFSNSLVYFLCILGIYWASFSFSSIFSESYLGATLSIDFHFITNIVNNINVILGTQDAISFPAVEVASWRLPFLLAGIFGLMLFILRQNLKETPEFLQQRQIQSNNKHKNQNNNNNGNSNVNNSNNSNPKLVLNSFLTIVRKPAVLITLLMTGAAGGQYHFYFVFLTSYFNKILIPQGLIQCNVSAAQYSHLLLCFAICLPISGYLADKLMLKYKLVSLLKGSAIIILLFSLLNILFMQQGYLPYSLMLLTTIALAFAQANTFVLILNQFNVWERCRGSSMGHALGSMLLSGSTPMISLWLWNVSKNPILPFCYFLILCFLSYVALSLLAFFEGKASVINTLENEIDIVTVTVA